MLSRSDVTFVSTTTAASTAPKTATMAIDAFILRLIVLADSLLTFSVIGLSTKDNSRYNAFTWSSPVVDASLCAGSPPTWSASSLSQPEQWRPRTRSKPHGNYGTAKTNSNSQHKNIEDVSLRAGLYSLRSPNPQAVSALRVTIPHANPHRLTAFTARAVQPIFDVPPAPPVRAILISSLLHATRPCGPRPRVKNDSALRLFPRSFSTRDRGFP